MFEGLELSSPEYLNKKKIQTSQFCNRSIYHLAIPQFYILASSAMRVDNSHVFHAEQSRVLSSAQASSSLFPGHALFQKLQ